MILLYNICAFAMCDFDSDPPNLCINNKYLLYYCIITYIFYLVFYFFKYGHLNILPFMFNVQKNVHINVHIN